MRASSPVLLLAACYAVSSEELTLHDERLRPSPADADADADADTDADADSDADTDTLPDGDDTLADANPLPVDGATAECLTGAISGTDLDYYAVEAPSSAGEFVWIWTEWFLTARLQP